MMTLLDVLTERFSDDIEERGVLQDKPLLRVRPEAVLEVAQAVKPESFEHLACITGVDYPDEDCIEVVYNLYSYRQRAHLVLKTRCSRDDARLPSVSSVWKSALFQERETYDLVGVVFEGHPDLKRILLPEPWTGHPLRKDYDMAKEQYVSKGPEGEDMVSFDPTEGW